MLPTSQHNNTDLTLIVPTLTIVLSHDNTTTTIILHNRNRWTLILGALFGVSTIHSYVNNTAFITIPDQTRLSLPLLPHHGRFCYPLLLYVDETISLKIPTYAPNDDRPNPPQPRHRPIHAPHESSQHY